MLRSLGGILLALALCACGMVSSDRPLFGAPDTRDAPVLKAGLWALVEPGCKFNLRNPPTKWPDCAQAIELRDGTARDVKPNSSGERDEPVSYLLAAGDPAILQAQAPKDPGARKAPFVYFGLRPLASDLDGTIIRARIWPALCAKPQPDGAAGPPARPARLLPGLVAGKDALANCLARGQGPVRNAVAQSEAWSFTGAKDEAGLTAYWLRDESRRGGGPRTDQSTIDE